MDNISSKSIKQTLGMLKGVKRLKDEGVNLPAFLWGNHGIGKTSIVEQFAKDNGYKLVILNLANLSPEDLLGQLDGKGGYYKPSWLQGTEDQKTIFFLDELNRSAKYVLQGIFNFINEGRIHNYRIKPEDLVISAGNPSDEYEVSTFEDPAFLSRFAHIKVAPDQKEFTGYLNSKDLKNTIVQQTLKKSISIYQNNDYEIGFQVLPDNRKLEKVAMMFEIFTDADMEEYGVDLLESTVGFDSSAAFLETWRESKKNVYDPKTILRLDKDEEYPFEEEDVEVINNINVKLGTYLKKKLTKAEKEGFVRYFNFIPRDIQVDFARQIVSINEDLVDLLDTDYVYELLNLEV